jgi:hypothetical protein
MSSGLPIFDGFVRRPALHDYHREMGLGEQEFQYDQFAQAKGETGGFAPNQKAC